MAESSTSVARTDEDAAALARWHERLQRLTDDVRGWVERAGWRTRTIEKPLSDRRLGRHTVPVLLMEKDAVEVALNPVSPSVPGAEGAVDLYRVPAYDDIASLYFEGGRWVLYDTQSGEPAPREDTPPMPLSEDAVVRVLTSFAAHAA